MAYDYERDLKSKTTSVEIDLGLKAYMTGLFFYGSWFGTYGCYCPSDIDVGVYNKHLH